LHQDPQNKLLQSGVLDMPTTGIWLLDIFVRRGLENNGPVSDGQCSEP